ncbi:Terminase large subunit, Lambdalikevirus-type [uncultured Caudovirales phage]|uniref:Terminase large subunit, Lambdalikevirus-type n=1 Tax=uncultured Caudovirales phage TaxID=2100421 RepID=A0A6J5LF01_9CAUD|nr:Terminase large subunit, Lambdalikevirus-type [uncultured Caudovirales phage]
MSKLTRGQRVLAFIDKYIVTPEGKLVGKPLELAKFQRDFILEVYDNPKITRRGILSIARKNGKSGLIAALLLAHIVGPEAVENAQIVSGAMSRDQAALVYALAEKMLLMQKAFNGHYKIIPSSKTIIGLSKNVTYKALAADGTTAHGLSPVLAILDEVGQVVGPTTPFIEAITSSQGAHENPLLLVISTQAPSDSDCLSLWIDDAIRSGDEHTVCHLHAADPESDLLDVTQWKKANPAIGLFRSEKDLEEQLKRASRLPALEASSRNLLLNQRVSKESLWLAPAVWKDNSAPYDLDIFRQKGVSIGLDLSRINDLCCAVMSAKDDDDNIHVKCYTFSPLEGIRDRATRDRVPYDSWADKGHIYAPPGRTLDYEMVVQHLYNELSRDNIPVNAIYFDRWAAKEFFAACDRIGFATNALREEVGQGFVSISPRITAMETALLQSKIRHGGDQPVLNLGAASAIVVADPSNNRKLDKAKASNKIDGIVAMLMSVYPHIAQTNEIVDVDAMIG